MRTLTPLSVVVLTKNEEALIERCIDGVRFADEIVVVDSGSTDRTRELAAQKGAVVIEQEWLGWSRQRNRGAEAARNDWIFVLEADEVVSPELERSIGDVLDGPLDARDGYTLERRSEFLGVLMPNEARRSKRRTFVRMFNRTQSEYDPTQLVHEEVRVPGRSIPLEGALLHWRPQPFDQVVSVINGYGTVEAEMLAERGVRATRLRILGKPILRFLWCYVRKGGFRMGTPGLIWAMLKASGEYYRYAKLWEKQNLAGADPSAPPRSP
jgi:glycosyltransferase involved in cell wall biosynthesis